MIDCYGLKIIIRLSNDGCVDVFIVDAHVVHYG